MNTLASYAQQVGSSSSSFLDLAIIIAVYAAFWRLFEKAGEEGWKGIIPIYNEYKLFELATGNGWRILLLLIPIYNIYVMYCLAASVTAAYGKEGAFKWGIFFLPFVFYPILAFGDSEYYGPNGMGDYRNSDARGASTVDFEVVENKTEAPTVTFDVKNEE